MSPLTAGQAGTSFTIDYEQPGIGQLRDRVTGRRGGLETLLEYWYAIADEARRIGADMLLVVDELAGDPLPPEQLQGWVGAMAGQGFEKFRIAYVEADGSRIALLEMAEIHAREHGYNARVFGNESDAAMWLRHGER